MNKGAWTKQKHDRFKKKIIKSIIKFNKISTKQAKLLLALSIFKPVHINDLEHISSSSNIRSLVRDTNKNLLKAWGQKDRLYIVSCYREHNLRFKEFYQLNFSPFIKKQ